MNIIQRFVEKEKFLVNPTLIETKNVKSKNKG
jgi:hypothetical protein